MGAVYEIEHAFTHHERALELLHREAAGNPGIVQRFLREASAAGRIGNPHVVETFDAGTLDSGEPYLVMELLAEQTLTELVESRGPLPPGELKQLMLQACSGVQAAHDAGIVHRDLKPDNLFMTERDGAPFVKILDFGISKFDTTLTGDHGLTSEGSLLGTPYYMPPEQVRGATVDERADVYVSMSVFSVDRLVSSVCVGLCCVAVASAVRAQPPASARKAEARERFSRGLTLFNYGDNAGALAEFERAQKLLPNPIVLYNIGLVQAAMGHAADAVKTLDQVLSAPGSLSAERIARARKARNDAAERIARLDITANVDGAQIEVDDIPVGTTPLHAPVEVTSGTRLVAVVAPGYVPVRREVTVAGRTRTRLEFKLQPLERQLAHLAVKTKVFGADVLVDGKPAGSTPLPATLALSLGKHTIEVRRPGYTTARPARQDVQLGEVVTGEVALAPVFDPSALPGEGGRLALDLSESDANVTIDGRPRGAYSGSIRLARGPHRLLVERAGFDPVQRVVDVPRGSTGTVSVHLVPTPEYRAAYESKAHAFRTWGWVGIVSGVVVAGAGTGYLVYNAGRKRTAQAGFDQIINERANQTGECDIANGADKDKCNALVDAYYQVLKDARARDAIGWAGVGVGAALLGTGAVLLITGDDPHRYDGAPEADERGRLRITPTFSAGRGGGSVGLVGRF